MNRKRQELIGYTKNAFRNKYLFFRIPVIALLLFSGLAAMPAPDELTGVKDTPDDTIWAQEQSYFVNLYKANYAEVVALYDEQFLGWPNGLKQPIGLEESSRFMKQLIPNPTSCTIRIDRAGIRLTGTTALTQYTLYVDCKDPSGVITTKTSRITHTWIKKGKAWKLLGGMSIDL
jgi:hypothetical protein